MAQDHRTNGLITLHRHGRAHSSGMGARSRSAFAYGDSDAAKRQRMIDLRQKQILVREHGPVEGLRRWTALVERHRKQFGKKEL